MSHAFKILKSLLYALNMLLDTTLDLSEVLPNGLTVPPEFDLWVEALS